MIATKAENARGTDVNSSGRNNDVAVNILIQRSDAEDEESKSFEENMNDVSRQ